MAITSFPWASVGGDRPVSDSMDAAYYAGVHGDTLIYGFTPTIHQSTNVRVSAGMAVVQGRVIHSDAAVVLTPTVNTRQRVVLRLDLTNRTAEVALSGTTTSYPSLTRNGSTWEMGLGTVDTTAATVVADTRHDFALCGIVDTGWRTDQLTAATGWSIDFQQIRRVGRTVSVYLSVTRTGGAISVNALGDFDNQVVATVPASFAPLRYNQVLVSGGAGRVATGFFSDLGIRLAAVSPGANIAQGESLSLGGTYLLG